MLVVMSLMYSAKRGDQHVGVFVMKAATELLPKMENLKRNDKDAANFVEFLFLLGIQKYSPW
jgi:hypothetical protein